ncbi:MAG: hypothetical protein HY703_04370 [Gemmatimonadetes bacterium]|nr:hypothetical protein [Gemmatimonadota bacterium]
MRGASRWVRLGGVLLGTGMAAAGLTSAAQAQGSRLPRWSVALELGAQLPATIYDERITARLDADSVVLSTRYTERAELAPAGRLSFRYRPESLFGSFVTYQQMSAQTRAHFAGGQEAPQVIERAVSMWSLEAGLVVQLGRWARGNGVVEYVVAPALVHQRIDLSGGHRDAFARAAGAPDTQRLDWTEREWFAWGVALGVGARVPVGRRLLLRFAIHDQVVPVATSQLEAQERADVRRLTGRAPVFLYRAFTAHYPSLRAGVEYVFDWVRPRPPPTAALPQSPPRTSPSGEALAAARLALEGDTAAALAALRSRVAAAPDDASAWRELALLLAVQAEGSPAGRDEAWQALQRALRGNPGDEEVLAAYGRVRELLRRAGVAAELGAPLALSGVSARGDAAGGLSLAWAVHNLRPEAGDSGHYRVQVEVADPNGIPVPLRLAQAGAGEAASLMLELERTAPARQPTVQRLELRLARARLGPHTVRLRVIDLNTGQAAERATGFEIR